MKNLYFLGGFTIKFLGVSQRKTNIEGKDCLKKGERTWTVCRFKNGGRGGGAWQEKEENGVFEVGLIP